MKIRFNLAFKLIFITSCLLALVVFAITYKNAELFEQVSIDKEESTSIYTTEQKAYTVDILLRSYMNSVSFIAKENTRLQNNNQPILDEEILNIKIKSIGPIVNELFLSGNKKGHALSTSFFNHKLVQLEKFESEIKKGKLLIFNSSFDPQNLNFIMGFPIRGSNNAIQAIVWSQIKSNQLLKIFKTQNQLSFFMIDSLGDFVVSTNENHLLIKDNAYNFIIKKLSGSNVKSQQLYIVDTKKQNWLITSSRLNSGLSLYSQIPKESILAPSVFMKKNSYYILGLILSSTIILIFLFSQHISAPIELLTTFSEKIGTGDLTVTASDKITSSDEVGDLAKSFDQMVVGLKERDKMKTLFSKFHGTAVTEELLKNEISLGGKRKDVTVFFSDIRGFTDFSEGHTPEEVVSMLNEYFEVMVHIINKHGGVVDKFIGDAIMAIWGVPHKTDSDADNAISACLEMRLALNKLNEERIHRNLVPIKIGIGLHSGEAISGQIGSSERMEFTVIGDAVNTASRVEGATKSFGTDLLISKAVIDKIKSSFIIEKAGEARVQGKSETLSLFKINGNVINGINHIIQTPYSTYEAVEDKKSKKES